MPTKSNTHPKNADDNQDQRVTARESRADKHANRRRLRRASCWTAFGVGLVVLGVVMAKTQEPGRAAVISRVPRILHMPLSLPDPEEMPAPSGMAAADSDTASTAAQWRTLSVQAGDTFAALLSGVGVGYGVIHALVNTGEAGQRLAQVYPGDVFRLAFDAAGMLQRVVYPLSPAQRLVFDREGDSFSAATVEEELERRLAYAHGVIETSLFQAAAELPDRLIMKLVNIFRWDIDFVYNIRRGDRFTLLYETFYKGGEQVAIGDIVAAEFINRGEIHRAVLYTNPTGEAAYFAPDGTSMRKTFLRTPVEFTRISSRYGQRYHPILGAMRMHDGIDYAAPMGTPIHATGAGRIIFRGRYGGYGNMIVVRHANRYTTAYGHMSRFAPGQSVGTWVSQGEVIGYVGSTGLSTGPHLHYEFRISGKHTNPLALDFPSVKPVAEENRDDFRQQIAPQLARLDTLHRAYASLEP